MREPLIYHDGKYTTTPPQRISRMARSFPGGIFYKRFVGIVWRAAHKAKRGQYDSRDWAQDSLQILDELEQVGMTVEISGIDRVKGLQGACIFIGNHMSMLETMILPGIIQPIKEVTFVVKESLLAYPVFQHVMRSRNPIAVTRTHPREDFKTVMEGGVDRLQRGFSLVIFPQTTRTPIFDPEQFNTIGMKLAKKADVPVIPFALLTDGWGNGRWLKDFGKLDPSKPIYFAFGAPLTIQGRGDQEHQAMLEFIRAQLEAWRTQRKTL